MRKQKNLSKKSCIKSILRACLWRIWLVSLLSVLLSVAQVAMALIFRYVIDAVLSGSPQRVLWSILLIVDLVSLVSIHGLLNWFTGSTADRFTAILRSQLLRSMVNCADSRLEAFHSGELMSRGMEDVRALCDGVVHALPALVGQMTQLVAAFAAVLFIYPVLAEILLGVGVVALIGVALLRPVLKSRQRAVRKAEEQVMSAMQEDAQQLELIQSLSVQEQILKRFQVHQKLSLSQRFRQRLWNVGSSGAINAVSMLGTGALLLWGAAKVATSALSYGSLTALIQLLNQFRSPVLSISGLWVRLATIEVASERLAELMEIPQAEHGSKKDCLPTAVVFENVTFRYQSEELPVFENFSLRLPLDGWACLSGFSGRGKSTLFKLILGLHKPQAGRVYLETAEGEVPCDADTRSLFAYVPQDYALFSGSVRENLLLVAPDAEEATQHKALETAKAEFVWEMRRGINTPLRENNTGLSKGQIQRLAIARALLMDRPILLLDECTSALDADTENAVLGNLRDTGKRALLVTHRPEALSGLAGVTEVSMEE